MISNEINTAECRCPTCGATQSWSNECRRCGTDFSFLRRLAGEWEALRNELATALLHGDRRRAESVAERLRLLSPTPFHEILCNFLRPTDPLHPHVH